MKQTILVTGGAGYIGGHFINALRKRGGYKIEVVDNFSQTRKNIINDPGITYHEVDVRGKLKLTEVFANTKPAMVVHFAALASVPDSLVKPFDYYENNVIGGLNLLEAMRSAGTDKIIFSSSASIYGEPQMEKIKENHPKNPTNPYGYTKLVFENILQHYHVAYGFSSIALRYFCAAGCNPSLEIGEYHNPETHVIPCIIQTLLGQRQTFHVFGSDYPTPDGTGIRDYIHVDDLAQAHICAMETLMSEADVCSQYNLGINKGFSVMELIKAAEEVSGKKVNYDIQPRRAGDPSRLIADSTKAQSELNWQPKFLQVKNIIETTYQFFKTRP